MLKPMTESRGEVKLREAFAASPLTKTWKLVFYPLLSNDSGYLEVAEPARMLRKMWLMEKTRIKTTLWKNMPDNVVDCWKKIRKDITGIPTAVFEHEDGDVVVIQKLDFMKEPHAVQAVIQSSNFLTVEMPTFFFTEEEMEEEPNEILAWVLRAVHDSDTPNVVQLGGKQFVISK